MPKLRKTVEERKKEEQERWAAALARADAYFCTGSIPEREEQNSGNAGAETPPDEPKANSKDQAESIDGDRLLLDVESFLVRFVIYPSAHTKVAHVLWIAHTHLMEVWDSTPRIAFLSPEPASGKSRALEVSELLVPSPVEAVNVTVAYLFRKVGDQGSTILFDEIDTIFGPKAKENEDIRGLLNAGHRRGAVTGRCVVRGNAIETVEVPAYCALALAGLGWLPDTIMSRSVIVRMRRRKPNEKVTPFRRRTEVKAGHALRDRLAGWARSLGTIDLDAIDMPAGVEDRNADVWEALFAVADKARGDWPSRAREAAEALIKEVQETEPSLGIRLLADVRIVFGSHDEMTTESLLRSLHTLPEAPWNDLRGKPINDRGLALQLRKYGIRPKVIRVGDSTPRGYRREDFHDAWETYLPSPLSSEGSATSATGATNGQNPNHFNGEFVADGEETSATEATASATEVVDVADSPIHVADHVADQRQKFASQFNDVAAVADVADVSGKRQSPPVDCIQCGGVLGPAAREITVRSTVTGQLASLHQDCLDGWMRGAAIIIGSSV
jgi:hypothetical protein